METLTLTLHKTKDTKNKVVYGTKDALGDVPPATLQVVISPAVSPGSLPGWVTALGRRGKRVKADRRRPGMRGRCSTSSDNFPASAC